MSKKIVFGMLMSAIISTVTFGQNVRFVPTYGALEVFVDKLHSARIPHTPYNQFPSIQTRYFKVIEGVDVARAWRDIPRYAPKYEKRILILCLPVAGTIAAGGGFGIATLVAATAVGGTVVGHIVVVIIGLGTTRYYNDKHLAAIGELGNLDRYVANLTLELFGLYGVLINVKTGYLHLVDKVHALERNETGNITALYMAPHDRAAAEKTKRAVRNELKRQAARDPNMARAANSDIVVTERYELGRCDIKVRNEWTTKGRFALKDTEGNIYSYHTAKEQWPRP